jgi:hypothetical protein
MNSRVVVVPPFYSAAEVWRIWKNLWSPTAFRNAWRVITPRA